MEKKRIISIVSILFLIIILLLSAYNRFYLSGTVKISDVMQKEVIVLSNRGSRNVHAIHLFITGYLNGKATLQLSDEEGNSRKYEIKQGKVRLPIKSDWYHDKCLIKYKPIRV